MRVFDFCKFYTLRYFEDGKMKGRNMDTSIIRCKMGKYVTGVLQLTYLFVTIDDNTELNLNGNFEFVPNPRINPIEPESGKVFRR